MGNFSVSDDWTKEQDMALRKAYFTARPSPHFWKRVSKMVFSLYIICFSGSFISCKLQRADQRNIYYILHEKGWEYWSIVAKNVSALFRNGSQCTWLFTSYFVWSILFYYQSFIIISMIWVLHEDSSWKVIKSLIIDWPCLLLTLRIWEDNFP